MRDGSHILLSSEFCLSFIIELNGGGLTVQNNFVHTINKNI